MLDRRQLMISGGCASLVALPKLVEASTRALSSIPHDDERYAAETRRRLQAVFDSPDRHAIYIPPGTWWIDAALLPRPNTRVICAGVIKAASNFRGRGATGGCVAIRHSKNVEWRGGELDGNNVTIPQGFNGLGLSAPQANRNPQTQNVVVEQVIIRNCRRDPNTTLGAGGGKGFTIQFGVRDAVLRQITIANCDFAFSLEGRRTFNGRVQDVSLDSISAHNCPYGIFINGTSAGPSYLQVTGRNISINGAQRGRALRNCHAESVILDIPFSAPVWTCRTRR